MRPLPILSAVFLTWATPVLAQVTVDLHALQALPEHRAALPEHRTAPAVTRTAPRATPAKPPAVATREAPAGAPAPATATPPAPQPALPDTVPQTAEINPIAPPAPPAGAAPPPPPVSDKAATAARTTTSGMRLTFAPGESDLSPDSSASIKKLTEATPSGGDTTFNVAAYAPGKPDDPSTARRISLSRAMAVRTALINDGVPSASILVRALGDRYGDGPPDRVDISVSGANSSGNTATTQ